MLSLACHDIRIMDCEYVARGETEEELVGKKVHGTEDAEITPIFKESYNDTSNILKNLT